MLLPVAGPIESSPLSFETLADPVPAAGEVRIRVSCCAVCRTDLHIIESELPAAKLPVIPGHQVVGRVDKNGPGASRFQLGDRIGIAWLRHTCGVCRFCKTGRENLCINSRFTGYHADGGYAQYATVPEAFAYPIPESFDDIHAAPLLCAGIIGYRAMLRANPPQHGRLAIFGFGSSAHIILQIARHLGHQVYVVSRSPNHQKLAMELGATWCGDDAARMPSPVESAIVFAPSGKVVPPALACLDPGGTVSLAGIHMSPIPELDYDKFLYGERDIHPVTANTREDGQNLLSHAAAARVRPHVAKYPLADANRALQDLKSGRIDGTAVLMMDD